MIFREQHWIFFFTTLILDWSYYIFLYSRSRNVIDYRNDQTFWKFVNSDWCFSQHDRLHWSLLTDIFNSFQSNAYRNCDYETYRCFWTYKTVPFEYIFHFIAINTLTNVYKISLYGYIQIFSGQPETSTLCMYLCLVTMCLSYVNNKKHIKKNLIKIRSLIHFLYFDLKTHSLRILPGELCFD